MDSPRLVADGRSAGHDLLNAHGRKAISFFTDGTPSMPRAIRLALNGTA
jgi:hypothetical protein